MIYLDNAATSFPKPKQVIDAVAHYLDEIGGNPGRAAHAQAREAGRVIDRTRRSLATLLGNVKPSRLLCTPSTTVALNLAFKGLLQAGDHVVTTSMEHNSVMRPLHALQKLGISHSQIPCSPSGELDPADILPLIQPQTRLIALIHGSNVTGNLMPVSEVGKMARERGILLLVDAAQTVGKIPIDPQQSNIDLLAGPGHKGLLGPMGTGFLYVRPGLELEPLWQGGTGTYSESMEQPETWPERFESGTLNAPGLAGLAAGIAEVQKQGLEAIAAHEQSLIESLADGLNQLPGIILYGSPDKSSCTGTLSFNVQALDCSEVAHILDTAYAIAVRSGLHCAPAAHRTINTFPHGTVRVSVSPYNTQEDIHTLIGAVSEIIKFRRR
ncbi:MAG: aminotransferase class V-fold PLP-dependent enzyme [Deltaproteobacteria bacterium]|jgi:cysteine desulfurase/selenocysteine lyase|nr:aminotransferase class V-fold PLP-dependent enzyme [Deltaproteobacteria bacterium]